MEDLKIPKKDSYVSTRNACKLCNPLGASVVFRGIKGCVPLIHGSQGCATYIRRYLISHYREPMDIASSNFGERSTIFGGEENFAVGIDNIISQYEPEVIGICSTCLSETIGDDVKMFISSYIRSKDDATNLPEFTYASTPSYQGTHMDGYYTAVSSFVENFAVKGDTRTVVNILPGFVSTEDLRMLKEILEDFDIEYIMLPDYSESMDNTIWKEYKRIPEGGTDIKDIKKMGFSCATIELGGTTLVKNGDIPTGGKILKEKFNIPLYKLDFPIGVKATEKFFAVLEKITGKLTPEKYIKQKGRLIDAYVDGHKYVFGKKAIVYGEEDFVIGISAMLKEIGVDIILAASGANSGEFKKRMQLISENDNIQIEADTDFESIKDFANEIKPDIFLGNSKGYYISRELDVPIVRLGFPIHDRMGGQRIPHLSYRGTQHIFDLVVNSLLDFKQKNSTVAYKYM